MTALACFSLHLSKRLLCSSLVAASCEAICRDVELAHVLFLVVVCQHVVVHVEKYTRRAASCPESEIRSDDSHVDHRAWTCLRDAVDFAMTDDAIDVDVVFHA